VTLDLNTHKYIQRNNSNCSNLPPP